MRVREGWLAFVVAVAGGCGVAPDATQVAATVRVDGLLADDTTTLSLYVLSPQLTDGVYLSCEVLRRRLVPPTDPKVVVLGHTDLDPASGTLSTTVDDVKAGDNLFVHVDAKDVDGTVIGTGCTDEVLVEPGRTVDVDVVVHPL